VLRPPPPVDFRAWAVRNVRFGEESPLPGPYDPAKFPFFDRILEVLGPDHPARTVVMRKSAQLGGTVLAQIFVGGALDMDPGPVLYVFPSDGNAKKWSRTKWRPMIRATTALSAIVSPVSSKEGGSSTLYQERKDGRGYLQLAGANSEASLSMVSMPRQVQDDLSKWEANAAGDPETQADSRSKAFEWGKVFKISTPLLADNCRITRNWKAGTQEHFHVPCPHCEHMHPLEWEAFRIDEEDPFASHFVCPECGGVIEDRHRPAMLAGGRWVANNPSARIVSFHLWVAYSLLTSLGRLAEEWIAARGDPAREQVFYNDTLGLAFEVPGESPPWEQLRDRANGGSRRGVVPPRGLLLVLSMDCQDDRVEWSAVAFGRDLFRHVVDAGVVEGHIGEAETWAALDKLLDRQFPDTFGNRRRIDLAGIDANAWTQDVFDWARRHPISRVLMLRGVAGDAQPALAKVRKERGRDGSLRRYAGRFYNVGVDPLKLGLYRLLAVTDPLQRGWIGIPAGLDDEWFQQLTAEKRLPVTNRRTGFTVYRWVKPKDARNEALDLMVYAEALALRLGWRSNPDAYWDRLAGEREVVQSSTQLDLEDVLASPSPPTPSGERRSPTAPTPAATPARRPSRRGIRGQVEI
jgi:phage terminase large subunit GpA-like protein